MAPRSSGDGQTDGIIEPSALADTVVEAMREERHVLPHPEVEEYVRRGDNIDRWLLVCNACESARQRTNRYYDREHPYAKRFILARKWTRCSAKRRDLRR